MILIQDINVDFTHQGDGFSLSIPRLAVHANEATFVFGPSGSGKTTLLNAILRWYAQHPDQVATTTMVGSVMHDSTLLPWHTVKGNLALEERLRSASADRQCFDALLRAFGLHTSVARKKSWQLSYGMRQRVELAKSMAFGATLLLLDEAISGVDEANKRSILRALDTHLTRTSGSLFFVTHDIGDMARLADRVLKIREGRLVDEIVTDVPRSIRADSVPTVAMEAWDLKRLLAA